eukprot:COSAG02_NODE_50877_length_317_cov_1.788991_1_plen_56_part_01
MKKIKDLSESTVNDVIAMAWCDKTPFESIEAFTGLAEKEFFQAEDGIRDFWMWLEF